MSAPFSLGIVVNTFHTVLKTEYQNVKAEIRRCNTAQDVRRFAKFSGPQTLATGRQSFVVTPLFVLVGIPSRTLARFCQHR
jgi:hypothetical protein